MSSCDIESCAMRSDKVWEAWGPLEMSCFCLTTEGEWKLSVVNLGELPFCPVLRGLVLTTGVLKIIISATKTDTSNVAIATRDGLVRQTA